MEAKEILPDKIFLGNPNIMYALGGKTETGTIRETFFTNQVGAGSRIPLWLFGFLY